MLPFKLIATETPVAPHGLITSGEQATALRAQLMARPHRYGTLKVAIGAGWAALFEQGSAVPETLPWFAEPPLYLYRLADGVMCQFGLQPDLPPRLWPQLLLHLKRHAGVSGPIALTVETDLRVYDFCKAVPAASLVAEPTPASATP